MKTTTATVSDNRITAPRAPVEAPRRLLHGRSLPNTLASVSLYAALALGLSGCVTLQTFQAGFCQNFGLGPNCEKLVFRNVLWPDVRIVEAASGPMIACRPKPNADTLQVVAHIRNYGREAGGPFWTKFEVTYVEHPSGSRNIKTYFVHSAWPFHLTSTSGASPPFSARFLVPSTPVIGALDGGQEADIVVTFDSVPGNLSRDAPRDHHENIKYSDGTPEPFVVHVTTNSEDPNNPAAPLPNVGVSDKTISCLAT